jgi:hypothetical protein
MGKALREKKSFGLPRKILGGSESEENSVGLRPARNVDIRLKPSISG